MIGAISRGKMEQAEEQVKKVILQSDLEAFCCNKRLCKEVVHIETVIEPLISRFYLWDHVGLHIEI